ncbi:MAG: penicillin acylase family protein [Candidatus Hydrogenedentes bacterium]|nr:penicillin acylase family protein [Candidatus Hydrogenedentota bacterium]
MKTVRVVTALCALAIVLWSCSPKETPPEPAPPASVEPATQEAAVTPPQGEPASGKQVTIYRDKWGVPHIYSETDAGAAFGLGYAQAEDRLSDIYANGRIATGTAAEAFGEGELRTDFAMRLVQNTEMAQQSYQNAPDYLKELADSFVAGVNAYVSKHPDKKPEWAIDFQPWHCSAIGRAMIMKWPLGTVFDDLDNKKKHEPVGRSNEWAISPKRTATGGAILLTDPHVGWDGIQVFYEARVHGDKLHMNGFFLVGSPMLGFGHSNNVGWAPTTGGPDTSDVFEVKVDMSSLIKPKYELDGQWHEFKTSTMSVAVKGGTPKTQPRLETHFGVVFDMDLENQIAYVGASPYFSDAGLFEQTYRMLLAKNTDEFYEAVGIRSLMEQNIMFADTSGNIQYVRNGRTPIRKPDLDWDAPVPASAETLWKDIHPIADLVQIKNPEQGYMQNCNISPDNMMKNSPLTADKYPNYIYNVSWDTNNPRSKRIIELLDGDNSVTEEEAIAYAVDVYDFLAKPWQEALAGAIETAGAEKMKDESFAKAVKNIQEWNGEFLADSVATVVYKTWRRNCDKESFLQSIVDGKTLTMDEKIVLVAKLAAAVDEVKTKYGSVEVPWGEVYRVGRSGRYFPAPGADFGGSTDGINMTETLLDVRSSEDKDNPGKYIGDNGSQTTMLMLFREDGIESYTLCPWGQSGDPASKHYVDQAEQLYGKRQMKPTWWKKEELLADPNNVESVLTLELP